MKVTNCSMGCMYATGPIAKCLCQCGGSMHAMMVEAPKQVKCSPAVEKRCKAGEEGGACTCACGGLNHGLYGSVDFSKVKINEYGSAIL